MNNDLQIADKILAESRVIAVVGISPKPDRPSHYVAEYLQKHGYRIIPVNPVCAGTHILGCLLYTSPSPRDLSTSRMPSSA